MAIPPHRPHKTPGQRPNEVADENQMAKIDPPTNVGGWITLLSQTYGPYGFGLVSLLIMWTYLVAPQLERASINFDRHQKLVEQTSENIAALKDLANTTQRTVVILEQIANRLSEK